MHVTTIVKNIIFGKHYSWIKEGDVHGKMLLEIFNLPQLRCDPVSDTNHISDGFSFDIR